jgi:hypothetical protein
MSTLTQDQRIKFSKTVTLRGATASVNADISGGPIALLQVAVFDSNNQIVDGIGFEDFGPPASSEGNGTATWQFSPKATASYLKWGVIALRSAAGLGNYQVTGSMRDADGSPLASGTFSARIPDGKLSDDIVYDGVFVSIAQPATASGDQ